MYLRHNRITKPGLIFWLALIGVGSLIVLGFINLLNADFYSQSLFHQKQAMWILIGMLVMGAMAIIDLRIVEAFVEVFYWGTILLLILVLIVGHEINHSKRWLFFGSFALEPSELAKASVLLMVAKTLHYMERPKHLTLTSLLKPIFYVLLPAFLIMMEPDLGTGLLIIIVSFSVFILNGMSFKSLGTLFLVITLLAPVAWVTGLIRPYQKQRLKVWMHLEEKSKGKHHSKGHFQPVQSVWAVGSGRTTGKGLRHATQSRLKYLPEMHTDFVFAIFAEERGFIGSIILILIYTGVSILLLLAGTRATDTFGALILIGTGMYIFWQSFINIGMVIGLLPVVGLTLPLFSYGGSSLTTTLFLIGLCFNVLIFHSKTGSPVL